MYCNDNNCVVLPFAQKREQLRDHEERVQRLEAELEDHRRHPPERSTKSLSIQNYKEKDVYLHYEVMMCLFCLLGNAGIDPVLCLHNFHCSGIYMSLECV